MNSTRLQICKRRRLLRLILGAVILAALGAGYAWFAVSFFGIPCLFHLVTGLDCPGCGATRAALRLLAGDISGAFQENAAVICLLPVGGVLALSKCVQYVQCGSKRMRSWENVMVWTMVGVLLAYGIGRNIAHFV